MNPKSLFKISCVAAAVGLLASCSQTPTATTKATTATVAEDTAFSVNYEKFTLDNGLEVVLHQDHSDPITAVALTFHVGSARELEGRTGFAHLFEHLLFLESENLGKGGLDKMSSRIGGSGANGSTSRDRTNYFQTVPNDALEKMIWAEADKLGYFINTVTDAVLAKEKQVVKNEKRQGVDNQPYGHARYVIGKNLYPESHPYNWQVIGSLEDLQNATLQDVKDFYNKWYVPNNATLVIAGDFDPQQAKAWVHKYFDEIPRGDDIKPLEERPSDLEETKKRFYEDNFARLPELRMVWPGVANFEDDAYALQILGELLAGSKESPLQKVLVDEKELTSDVYFYNSTSEIAGEVNLITRAYPGTDLDDVQAAVNEAFARFEKDGFSDDELKRVKAGLETEFYNGLSDVLGKAFQLAQYNIFAGDPGYINEDLQKSLAVTREDIMRVYNTYIKGQPFVATSFVPKGEQELALAGSAPAQVEEEVIVANGRGEDFEIPAETEYARTPSSFDRSVEPAYGKAPVPAIPDVWQTQLQNGMAVSGINNTELPLVEFALTIKGGHLLETAEKSGTANLLAELLTRGTATKTPEQLQKAIDMLGASIHAGASSDSFTISGTTLSHNYAETMALVTELLLEPRWDVREFELAKQSTLSTLAQQKAEPNAIASIEFMKLLYGEDSILSIPATGTEASVNNVTMTDLKTYYENYLTPSVADFLIVGDVKQQQVTESLTELTAKWKAKQVALPDFGTPAKPDASKVYFYDVPGAKQSVLRFGYLALAETDADFYPATVMNYKLGGGGFASRLTQALREGKGYTYGIRSGFQGSDRVGPFQISSGVRTNVTYESAALVKEILEDYPASFTEEDLANTKSFMEKSTARQFETYGAKLNLLEKVTDYGWEPGYVNQRLETVKGMTVEEIKRLANTYADPEHMIWLVVGDAETQLPRLNDLGFGEPVLLNPAE